MLSFLSLETLKTFWLYIFILSCIVLKSQDKIYFTDGSVMTGKVTEISPDAIMMNSEGNDKIFNRNYVLMIEYKNGRIEKYTTPEKSAIYNEDGNVSEKMKQKSDEVFQRNQLSLNTLALCNSDISVFYEHITKDKKLGLGLMSAYNFNTSASLLNSHLLILTSAKKNYDVGAFFNLYMDDLQTNSTAFYGGIMIKYTNFNFTSVITDSVKVGNIYVSNTKFTPEKGGQLSAMFTCGTYNTVTKNFFIKTIFGIGGFALEGVYKQQYNYYANSGVNVGSQVNRSVLLKLYLGINAGFTF